MNYIERYAKYISDQEYNNREQHRLNEMYPDPVTVIPEPIIMNQEKYIPINYSRNNDDRYDDATNLTPVLWGVASICGLF